METSDKSTQTSITDLPEAVLLHILSFLPPTDAVKTSVVTPPWRHLWCSLPSLEFDMRYLPKQCSGIWDREVRSVAKFNEFVSQTLLRRLSQNLSVQKFKLVLVHYNKPYVDSWIRMLVGLKAVEIDLEAALSNYEFCFSDVVSSSIEVLKLRRCIPSFPRDEVFLDLHSMKELHLENTVLSAPEIERLMACCVNLEAFVLVQLPHFDGDLNIVSRSLRHLSITCHNQFFSYYSRSVEICTPKLESIELDEFCIGMYTLKDVSSLVEATASFYTEFIWDYACWINTVSSLTSVERLTLRNNHCVDRHGRGLVPYETYEDIRQLIEERESFRDVSKLKFGEEVFSDTFVFHNLKYLTLKTKYSIMDILSLESFLKKCPRLETLVLVSYGYTKLKKQLKEDEFADSLIVLEIPHLREVKLEEYFGTKNELFVVDLLKQYGVVLEKIMAFPAKLGQISPPPFCL